MTDGERLSPVDEFAQLYAEREELQRRADDSPDFVADLLRQGVAAADNRLGELSQSEEVREYYTKLGGEVVKASRTLEEAAPTLERLGLQGELEAKRQEIESILASAQMRAARYFVRMELAGIQVFADESVPRPPQPTSVPTPPAPAERREAEKTALTMFIDPEFNIAFNTKVIPTGRSELQVANRKGWTEIKVRQMRAEAVRFLAEQPGQQFRSRIIWEAINPDEPFAPSPWANFVAPFLQAGHKFNRKLLIRVDKSDPHRTKYALGDFNVKIERTEKSLKIKNEAVFTLPDGREVAGKTGRFLNMLWRANTERPVTHEVAETMFTAEELEAMPEDDRRHLLSALASRARREVRDTHYTVMKVLTDQIDPESHRYYPAYFMVNTEVASVPGSVLSSAEDLTVEEREAVIAELEEEGLDKPLSLHEATVLSGFLNVHRDRLINRGLEPLPPEIMEALNQRVIETYTNGGKSESELKVLRVVAFEKAQHLLSDVKRLEEAVDEFGSENDPREALLMHLMEYNTDEKITYIKELLDSVGDIEITFDGGKGFTGRGFGVEKAKAHRIGPNGETL